MRQVGSLPFAGRDEELSLLHDLYMRALHNERQVVIIEGEPGIGKSTLVEEFLSGLGAKGALVMKTYGAPSYGGFRSVFAGLLRSFLSTATPQEISASNLFELGTAAALSRLAPEIRDIIPFEIPTPQELDPGVSHEMEQTLDGLRLFVLRLATRKPLALVFEDAHWLDSKSWEALNFLSRTLGPFPILIIVTVRSSELESDVEREANILARTHPVEKITMSPLPGKTSRRMIEIVFGKEIAASIGAQVQTSTGGNPLYLHETISTLVERGFLQHNRDTDRWEQVVDIRGKLPAPESSSYIFEERISGFAEEEIELFRLASLFGLRFYASWLKDLSGMSEDHYIDTINRALKANLLVSDFQGKLTFYHQLIQRHLRDSISESSRVTRRRQIYEYFLERAKTHPAEGPFHRFLACESYEPDLVERHGKLIVENNLAAARDAFASFSTTLALKYLETARLALQRIRDLPDEEHLRLLFQVYTELGRVALESGHAQKAAVYFRATAIHVAPHLKLELDEQIRLVRELAEAYYKTAHYRRIGQQVTKAVALAAGGASDAISREMVKLQFIAGLSLYNQGQYDTAIRETEQGLEALRERNTADPQLELEGLRVKGIILNRIGRHTEAEEVFTRSLQLAEGQGDRRELGRAHYYLGVVAQYLGQYNTATERYQNSIAICREADDLETLSKIYNNLGVHYSESGDPLEAERHFRRALESQQQIGAVYASLTTRINLAGSLQSSGRTEEALLESENLLNECERINAVNLIPAVFDSRIEIAIHAGNYEIAEETLERMKRWLGKTQSKFGVDHMKKLGGQIEILKGAFKSGWALMEETVGIYSGKSEKFRAAQAMADGVSAILDAVKNGAQIDDAILSRAEVFIGDALEAYRELNFPLRVQILRNKVLSCDGPDGRFARLVAAKSSEGASESIAAQDKLQLRCFGRLKVVAPGRHDETEESAWPSKKARGLLAYLAVTTSPGRPALRDRICDTLWPHLGPDTILSSFHVTLSHLRKTLNSESTEAFKELELVSHSDGTYNLDWSDHVWCDIQEFDRLYQEGKTHLSDNKVHLATQALEQARNLYQGPLLEDMYDSWLEERRDEYRRRFVEISQKLADICFDRDDFDRAISLSQETLLVDPTEEPSHRLLMLSLFTTGRKAAAVNQYNACVKALRKRLDIEPDQKTIDLAEMIKSSAAELTDVKPSRAKMLYV